VLLLEGDGLPADCTVESYQAIEAISAPFEIDVEFFTQDDSFTVDALLRKSLLLVVINEQGQTRNFHGVVDQARFCRVDARRMHFAVRLVPALAALAHRADSRIFQNQSIVDIVSKLFDEAGFLADVQWQLTGTYDPKEFVVQYRESALNFVSRLFEDAGIFYFFQHKPGGHTMIVADSSDAFVPMDDAPATLFSLASTVATGAEVLPQFSRTRSLRTSSVEIRDYDFEKPQVKPDATLPNPEACPSVYYEYPAGFLKGAEGSQKAKARMRELRRDADVCRGSSTAIGLRCGVPFTVDGAAEDGANGSFVVTSLLSRGHQASSHGDKAMACENQFAGIPAGAPFAAPRNARRPRIRGLQTAVVTGPSTQDESIHVDKYARIKVRFYWDRVNQQNDTSSCWIRTVQVPTSGSIIHPRTGWEVSVAFLDGDPDRPICLGRLYNAEKTPPYPLPGANASSSLKSMSSPGGAGHNEIKMSDTGGSQGFGVTAQKDFNVTIGNDKTETVAVDETHSVSVNMNSTVGSNDSLSVGADQSIDVGANLSHTVKGAQSVSVGGNDTSNADCDYMEKITGNRSYTVSGNQFTLCNGIEQTITGAFSRTVGAVHLVGSVASVAENVIGGMTETNSLVKILAAKGSIGETVKGDKNLTSTAAELHLIKGSMSASCAGSVTNMVGGLHYEKIDGAYAVKGKTLTLVGGVGIFKGGSSEVKLGGGPITITGSAITLSAPMIVKLGSSLKMGSGG
jgi:type VI secretion system secreted protein VgrG